MFWFVLHSLKWISNIYFLSVQGDEIQTIQNAVEINKLIAKLLKKIGKFF